MNIPAHTDAHGNELGKLFIGGLDQTTTNESLRNYFSKFGEVEEALVMMDNRTNRSRGFGYVKFKHESIVESVLQTKPHIIDGKEVDTKQCNVNMKGKNRRSLKIFVGGIAPEQNEETVKTFFQQFGEVTDVNLMIDPAKQRHRGFAFVGFEDEQVVQKLIQLHYVSLNGKQVEIKAMEPPNPKRDMRNPGGPMMNGNRIRGRNNQPMNPMQAGGWPQQAWGQPNSWNANTMWPYAATQQTNAPGGWDQSSWNQWAAASPATANGQWNQSQQAATNAWANLAAGVNQGAASGWPQSAMPTSTSQWGSWDPQSLAAATQNGSAASGGAGGQQWNGQHAAALSYAPLGQAGGSTGHGNLYPYKR